MPRIPASALLLLVAAAGCGSPGGTVPFAPGGPETARRFALILAGEAEHAFTAARNATLAASTAVPSKPVYGFAPVTFFFQ